MDVAALRQRKPANPTDAGAAGELAAAVKRKPLPPAFSWAALVLALVLAFGVVKRAGSSSSSPLPASPALLSAAQLAAHTGLRRSKIYLAVLGTVFDVTSGKRHYGPGGGYSHFAGRDGSRAFVTGNFSADLNDDINDFTAEQHAGVVRWRKFYQTHKAYRQVGRVIGRFYDADGDPTPLLILAETQAERQQAYEEAQAGPASASKGDGEPCNVSWTTTSGGWVHCNGQRRPRRVLVQVGEGAGSTLHERCACFDGDVVSQAKRLYDGCAADSIRCQTSQPEGAAAGAAS